MDKFRSISAKKVQFFRCKNKRVWGILIQSEQTSLYLKFALDFVS